MDPVIIAIFLIVSAIAVGVYLVFIGVRNHKRSPGLAFAHAGLALCGVIALFIGIFTGPLERMNNVAAFFLFFAVVGGGIVFALHEKNRPPSMGAVAAHAVMGLIGISLLILNIFQ